VNPVQTEVLYCKAAEYARLVEMPDSMSRNGGEIEGVDKTLARRIDADTAGIRCEMAKLIRHSLSSL
jgi:hypothetical protein